MSATPNVLDVLKEKFPAAAARASLDHPAINVPAADAHAVLQFLRDTQGFDFLVDVTAIDWAAAAAAAVGANVGAAALGDCTTLSSSTTYCVPRISVR